MRGVPTPPGVYHRRLRPSRPSEPVPGWAKHRGSVNETLPRQSLRRAATSCTGYRYDASSRRRAYVTPSESHERGEGDATLGSATNGKGLARPATLAESRTRTSRRARARGSKQKVKTLHSDSQLERSPRVVRFLNWTGVLRLVALVEDFQVFDRAVARITKHSTIRHGRVA